MNTTLNFLHVLKIKPLASKVLTADFHENVSVDDFNRNLYFYSKKDADLLSDFFLSVIIVKDFKGNQITLNIIN